LDLKKAILTIINLLDLREVILVIINFLDLKEAFLLRNINYLTIFKENFHKAFLIQMIKIHINYELIASEFKINSFVILIVKEIQVMIIIIIMVFTVNMVFTVIVII